MAESAGSGIPLKRPPEDVAGEQTPPLKRPRPAIPDAALLFHVAVSAHVASHVHLQQVFIPRTVSTQSAESPIIYTSAANNTKHTFVHDEYAAHKAIALLALSLDCLRAGWRLPGLSYAGKIAFGAQFGIVALELLGSVKARPIGGWTFDQTRLIDDAQEIVSKSFTMASQNGHSASYLRQLDVTRGRLAHVQNMSSLAKRMIRNMLRDAPRIESAYRHTLLLLLCDIQAEPQTRLEILGELLGETSCPQLTQVILLVRLGILFTMRDWSTIPSALRLFETALVTDDTGFSITMQTQCVLLKSLLAARMGDDQDTKNQLKAAYALMDRALETDCLKQLRRSGGVLTTVSGVRVRITPPNIMFMLTYLTTVACKRDFIGDQKSCKTLIYASSLRRYANVARRQDMWDLSFSVGQTLADAVSLQAEVRTIQAEVMMEEIAARIFRTEMTEAEQIFGHVVDIVRGDHLDGLVPHLLLLRAQREHLLGRSETARGLYLASKSTLVPGSEMGLLLNICLLAANGDLVGLDQDPTRASIVAGLVAQCKSSSDATIKATGAFLASLADGNIAAAKYKITAAYELACRVNNNVLRLLIFAFTTSTHLTGTQEKILKQLDTGREIAWMMGGKERQDGVGQVALGLWFAVKLKGWHRMLGNEAALERARMSAQAHKQRLAEVQSTCM